MTCREVVRGRQRSRRLVLTGKTLINLDSEEDGVLTVGCAGSTDTWVHFDAPRESATRTRSVSSMAAEARRSSGVQMLSVGERDQGARQGSTRSDTAAPFRLVSLNEEEPQAIPRDAVAVCSVPPTGGRVPRRSGSERDRQRCLAKTDSGRLDIEKRRRGRSVEEKRRQHCSMLCACANRAARDEPRFRRARRDEHITGGGDDEGGSLTLHSLSRSSNDSALPEVIAALDAAARLGGGTLEVKHNYNGWRPSSIASACVARTVYEQRLASLLL